MMVESFPREGVAIDDPGCRQIAISGVVGTIGDQVPDGTYAVGNAPALHARLLTGWSLVRIRPGEPNKSITTKAAARANNLRSTL